jgi:hypothetical protein
VVSSVSVTTPLLVGDIGFPVTVQNLKTVTLNTGAGTAGQVLALDSSLDLIFKDDAVSVVPTIAQVLNAGNDADGNNLINLQSVQAQALNLVNDTNWALATNAGNQNLEVTTDGDGLIDLGANSIYSTGSLTGHQLTIKSTQPVGEDNNDWQFLCNNTNLNLEISSNNGGYITLSNTLYSSNLIGMSELLPTVNKTPYDVWVSPTGNNATANVHPSILQPFQSIAYAIAHCEALTAVDNVYRYIHVLGGNYTENLTITKKVYIIGEAQTSQSTSVGCQITGLITIAVDANATDMFSNGVHLQGLLISGSVLNVSTVPAMLIMENCYVYTPNDATGTGITHNVTSSDSRLKLWNVQVISSGKNGLSPLINVQTNGQVSMNYCYVSAKGVQQCMRLSGTATCDSINNCKFENSNTATVTAEPIVKITANVSGTYTFSNCAFIYSNNGDKSTNLNASGILNNNGTGNNTVISLYNTFLLAGTSRTLNYAIQDLNHTNPAILMICLYYMCGAIPNTAFAIRGNNNQTKFQLEVCS